ncbi:MAG: ComF family protein [Alphaproteobacteria bacterium]|nr:ComF family protein [Alphaproteobacteria bacterium]
MIFARRGAQPFGRLISRTVRTLADLLFPPLCLLCRSPVDEPLALCGGCWRGLTFLDGAMCATCGLPFEFDPGAESLCGSCLSNPPAFDCARAAVRYDDASKGAILALKRADRLEFADLFARWLRHAAHPLLEHADLIVPVPLHRFRLWSRRYNQSAILAQRLHRMSGKRYDPFALVRARSTPSQGEMPSVKARRRNVRGAFRVPERRVKSISGASVLLVDDVLTTGATIEACARTLKRAGAKKVFVITIARVARPLPRDV